MLYKPCKCDDVQRGPSFSDPCAFTKMSSMQPPVTNAVHANTTTTTAQPEPVVNVQPAGPMASGNVAVAQPSVPHSVVPGGAAVDVASILAKVQQLEHANQTLQMNFQNANAQLSKFKEGKRAEMEALLNSTISSWLENLETKDAASKAQLQNGLKALAADGNESGVWEVVACASNRWHQNVTELEQLRTKLNSYEEREKELAASGMFSRESDRLEPARESHKRKADELSAPPQAADIWGEFESMLMNRGGNTGDNWAPTASESANILDRLNRM